MLDRPTAADASPSQVLRLPQPRWPFAFLGLAGLMGAAGVAVGAAGAHLEAAAGIAGGHGAQLAGTASSFLTIHAAAVTAGAGAALATRRTTPLLVAALGLLVVGAVLFGGDLALLGLFDRHPVPLAAPAGGLCLIAGWLCLSVSAAAHGFERG